MKNKDWKTLKAIADQWNTAYNFIDTKAIDANTNPKLLVSAGAYIVKSSTPGKSMTLVENLATSQVQSQSSRQFSW